MKLPDFEHHCPATVDEAIGLLDRLDDAKVIAGGQSLVPVLALRMAQPAHLVDIGRISNLSEIVDDGDWLRIGAAVRQSTVERWPQLRARVPVLAAALPNIGHRAIRNRGTVCGSLAHADPAAELPTAAVVSGAEFEIVGSSGRRTVAAADFFQGHLSTAIGERELLVEVRFPIAPPGQGAAVVEVSRRHGDFAMVGAAATVTLDESGAISGAALALFGVADRPVSVDTVEDVLIGVDPRSADAFEQAGEIARRSVAPAADESGTTEYKQQLAAVMTRRALRDASGRAGAPR